MKGFFQLDGAGDDFKAVEHHQHQEELERTLDFAAPKPLSKVELQTAKDIFTQYLRVLQRPKVPLGYDPIILLRVMYEEVSMKEKFLRYLFIFLESNSWDIPEGELDISAALHRHQNLDLTDREQLVGLGQGLATFAEHLVSSFFLPMRACGPTPQTTSSKPTGEYSSEFLPTSHGSTRMRTDCMERDGRRCVISLKFDMDEASTRNRREGKTAARDDDDQLLSLRGMHWVAGLEACHIVPHALAKDVKELPTKAAAWHVLSMFDANIGNLVGGPKIDEAYNAITLTHDFHRLLGAFRIYFEPAGADHCYNIKLWDDVFATEMELPVTRTLRLDPKGKIRPPSPRLLAIHHAIGNILYLSGAGSRIDDLLKEMDDVMVVAEDGSTDLSTYINARIGGWSEICAN